jgi:hypothetical protein
MVFRANPLRVDNGTQSTVGRGKGYFNSSDQLKPSVTSGTGGLEVYIFTTFLQVALNSTY